MSFEPSSKGEPATLGVLISVSVQRAPVGSPRVDPRKKCGQVDWTHSNLKGFQIEKRDHDRIQQPDSKSN
ncbi:MAG: hypothetical protein EOP09_01045 [Proteobacteria bacterium]|nr:MAG: hypothetical protein EOP09_01045 [Pseudomonadota bacterium]